MLVKANDGHDGAELVQLTVSVVLVSSFFLFFFLKAAVSNREEKEAGQRLSHPRMCLYSPHT